MGFAAVAVRRRVLGDWTGAPARLAEVVIGLALIIAILELLGAVGLFALGPVADRVRARLRRARALGGAAGRDRSPAFARRRAPRRVGHA